ncbi:MAG: hypothetical protein C4518_04535 [Desulfobacteraceae bacterium]|nr:MAG: hypothetical protein C4518_04535 [Desulfobacteraceae bacterium]
MPVQQKKERIIYLPKSKAGPGDYERCPICGKDYKPGDTGIVRGLWLSQGGMGVTPPIALVHVKCDQLEQARQASKDRWNP